MSPSPHPSAPSSPGFPSLSSLLPPFSRPSPALSPSHTPNPHPTPDTSSPSPPLALVGREQMPASTKGSHKNNVVLSFDFTPVRTLLKIVLTSDGQVLVEGPLKELNDAVPHRAESDPGVDDFGKSSGLRPSASPAFKTTQVLLTLREAQ
ncbi:hypothetical protein L202_03835 [Cryptococcus amylolentus CBS 6039]|uniref:Uncharacterized protein n=1 Tax=Cryptococcus amylolentus CBS 6039 TaxID=1295533 RepID=A0A1E3HWH9_9TREE|nr:hypothetical protein L202_03835 [Cryptococcus amylolentus CBS 6039]ODN79961.1 hypothetical protein L202_03835 [Cryptococcus amylolentus CBS 6039]